jgi:hypothetical protein
MPPKKKKESKLAKAQKSAGIGGKSKSGQDKTFGMKNKKGKKAQEFQKNANNSAASQAERKQAEDAKRARALKKAAMAEKKIADLAFARAVTAGIKQVVCPPGEDPKNYICEFFKAGKCTKGDRCRFSHELNLKAKKETRSMYGPTDEEKGMEGWNQVRSIITCRYVQVFVCRCFCCEFLSDVEADG